MNKIKITYDTGDSFHQENGLEQYLSLKWKNIDKAKQALKDIERHYRFYMTLHKNWDVDNKDKESASKQASKQLWYYAEYPESTILLENDKGKRELVSCFWCGYFESLVGADIEKEDNDLGFKI